MAVTFKLEELLQARTSEDKAGKELIHRNHRS